MGFVTLEDLFGKIDLVIFPKVWDDAHHLVNMDQVLIAEGKVDLAQSEPKILVDTLTQVSLDELGLNQPGGNPDPPFGLDDAFLEDYLPDLPLEMLQPINPDDDILLTEHDGFIPEEQPSQVENEETGNLESKPHDLEESFLNKPETSKPVSPQDKQTVASQASQLPKRASSSPAHVLTVTLPKPDPLPRPDQKPRCIYITLDSCGDKQQDVRRLRRIHDILVSRPGRDQFAFRVRENGYWYEINFPNVTTGLTDTLIRKLRGFLGEHNIDIV